MKSCLSLAVLLLAVSAGTGFAQVVDPMAGADRRCDFQVQAIAARNFGNSRYEMNALAPDPREPQTLVSIRSELEFPVDVTLAGVRIVWKPGAGSLQRWQFGVELLTNLGDPDDRMTNRDFVAGREVIHTESETQLDLWQAALDLEYSLHAGDRTSVSLSFGVQYEKIDAYAVGYEGWQKSLFSESTFDISGADPVLDYQVTYVSALIGGVVGHRIVDHLQLELQGAFGPVLATDEDDHLLRGRISKGKGTGIGLVSGFGLELLPGSLPVPWLSVHLAGGLTYLYAEGGVDQVFTNGKSYFDLPYKFESLQPQLSISLGASF